MNQLIGGLFPGVRNKTKQLTQSSLETASLFWCRFNASHANLDCYYLGHHKCASNWMRKFLYSICQSTYYNYKIYGGDKSTEISSPWRKYTFHLYVNSTSQNLEIIIPNKKLDDIVQKCSFKSLSGGRDRGQENLKNHFRKGITGDWKNYMEEDGPVYQAFYERYGHLVSLLGYE